MSDNELLGMAKIAKSNQIKAEAKRAKEEKEYLEKEKTDQSVNLSRVQQFIDIMIEHDIPSEDFYLGSQLYKGWIVQKPYDYQNDNGSWAIGSGLSIMEDLTAYYWRWSGKGFAKYLEGMPVHGKYFCDNFEGLKRLVERVAELDILDK